jgi:hypothetical protein
MDHYIRSRFNRYEIESAKCPEVPTLPLAQVQTEANKILSAAGAQSCQTDASIQQFEAQMRASVGFASTAAGVKASNSNTSTIGCDQLTVIANKYNKTVQNVACMLKTSKNVTRTTASGINNIIWESTNGDIDVECGEGGLNFSQKMNLQIISKVSLSSQELTQIANEVNDVVKTVAEAVQDSKSGIGATPQGQKAISDTLTNINTIDQKNKIDETIKELVTSISGANTVTIRAKGNIKIRGNQCRIDQDMVLNMIADQVVNDAVSTSLSALSKTVSESESRVSQKGEALGAESLALKLADTTVDSLLILGIVGIIVLGVVVFLMTKFKKVDLNKMAESASSAAASSNRI